MNIVRKMLRKWKRPTISRLEQAEMRGFILTELEKSQNVIAAILKDKLLTLQLQHIVEEAIGVYDAGGKILFAGNGGSAGDAQHWSAELVSRFNYDRPALAAIALTTDTSALTAIGNDYGYERLFSRQIEALGNKGDMFVAISTSGNSPNILAGLKAARTKGLITVGFTGKSGGKMADYCDYTIRIPSEDTPKIQEGHAVCGHIFCGLIEATLFPKKP